MKCEGNVYLQRGTADAAALGGNRHVQQLKAACLIFEQSEALIVHRSYVNVAVLILPC